ncbi:MAG: ATP-binding protein [Leptolyngbya sp. SIO4C1]|nr:ATP-binding protein [Leptolyngbya sp. SIO4C1]
MATLEQLIRRSVNPFDPTTFKPGNFWQEHQDPNQEVASIHQEVLDSIEQSLAAVVQDHQTRTILLAGDSGSGKSYLLGRLKQRLVQRACFAYIGPWPDGQFIWRHTLRQTVDSLVQVPEGETEAQLIRWIRGLPAFQDSGLAKWVLGERRLFVRDLRASFPGSLYNAKEFFGVLYDLTNPELRPIAYDWLRGDDLDEEDLKAIRVKRALDSENAAQKILSNFGRLAASTQPIVLCFDNLDNIPLLANGRPDLQSLFNLNSTIHNEKLSNFLIVISIITSTWRQNQNALQPADLARLNQRLVLKMINLDQAMALWASRLAPLHQQASPSPESAIAPLSRQWLARKYPGGKTLPRSALMLGQQLIQHYKEKPDELRAPALPASPRRQPPVPPAPPPNLRANFGLVWQAERQRIAQQVTRIGQLSSPELIRRLQEALEALQVPEVATPFLQRTKFAAYSLTYAQPGASPGAKAGVVWAEDPSMRTFFYVMRACEKAVCDRLYLLRAAPLGKANTQGHKLFKQIFADACSLHIQPDLQSVQMLETYHRLVNAACGGELVVGPTTPTLKQLQQLIRDSGVFNDCLLLQALDIVPKTAAAESAPAQTQPQTGHVRQQILDLMATQSLMGLQVLVEQARADASDMSEAQILQLIEQLCQAQRLKVLDPNAKPQEQLICWVPIDD